MPIVVFWIVTAYSPVSGYRRFGGRLLPKDGGFKSLWDARDHLQHYTASQTECVLVHHCQLKATLLGIPPFLIRPPTVEHKAGPQPSY
jgi:hypothetical protein